MVKILKYIIPYLTIFNLFNIPLFFIISNVFGYNYSGISESNVLVYYLSFLFILSVITYSVYVIIKGVLLSDVIIFIIFISFYFIHLTWSILDNNYSFLPDLFIYHVILCLPSMLMVRFTKNVDIWLQLEKYGFLFNFIVTSLFVSSYMHNLLFSDTFKLGLAGATYQKASYFSALFIGLNLYFIKYHDFDKKYLLKFLYYVTLFFLIIILILNGGRGAFILFLIYLLIHLDIKQLFSSIQFYFFLSMIIIFLIYANHIDIDLIPNSIHNTIELGWYRVTQIFKVQDDSIINNVALSARDYIYYDTIKVISNNLLTGIGAYTQWEKLYQPHNIFLELLLQFGFIAIFINIYLIYLLFRLSKANNHADKFLFTLYVYQLVYLSFSGTYLMEPIIWFIVLYKSLHLFK